jgi:hypothetical protein
MSKLAIVLVSAFAVTLATAQDTASGQRRGPATTSTYETHLFLFDGPMRGDGIRHRSQPTIVTPTPGPLTPEALETPTRSGSFPTALTRAGPGCGASQHFPASLRPKPSIIP